MKNFGYKFTMFNVNDKAEIAKLVKEFDLPVVSGTNAYMDWFRKDIPLRTWDYINFVFNKLPKEKRKLDNLITVLELRYMCLQSSEKNAAKISSERFKKVLLKQIPITKKETLEAIDYVKAEKKKRELEAQKSYLEEFLLY
jgi:hypothetical protein